MTEQEMRIAIAEYVGLKPVNNPHYGLGGTLVDCWSLGVEGDTEIPLPNYPQDLNAMHEAEKVLLSQPGLIPHELGVNLLVICQRDGNKPYYATALQRAEAFCKTVGIWKD